MSASQEDKYFRRWSAVAAHLRWKMQRGRLHPEAVLEGSPQIDAIVRAACARAAQHARAITAGDLRHGCHVAACGRDKSHTDFTNRDFDKLLNLWGDERTIRGLLFEPTDLAALISADHPEQKVRERYLRFLTGDCIEAYVREESERMFGTADFETLEMTKLEWLHDHLRDRPHALKSSLIPALSHPTGEGEPDPF